MNAGEISYAAVSLAGLGVAAKGAWNLYRQPERNWRRVRLNVARFASMGLGVYWIMDLPNTNTWRLPALVAAVAIAEIWSYASREVDRIDRNERGPSVHIVGKIDADELQRNIDEWRKGMR